MDKNEYLVNKNGPCVASLALMLGDKSPYILQNTSVKNEVHVHAHTHIHTNAKNKYIKIFTHTAAVLFGCEVSALKSNLTTF